MLRGADIEVAFVVEGSIVDGYIILITAKVVAGISDAACAVIIIDDAIHTGDEHGLRTMLDESHRCSAWRFEVFALHLALFLDETGEDRKVATLPEIMMLIFVDMGKEYIRIALSVLPFLSDSEKVVCSFLGISVFYRIETISCSTQQDIAIVTFYHRIDTWLSAIRKLETGEIVRLIIIAHQSLGTTYPQVTFLIYQQVGDNVVSNGGCIFFVVQIVGKAVAVELAESVFGSHPDISVFILHNAVDKRT